MSSVIIRNIEVYHGEKIVPNEIYLEHFKKRNKDMEHYLKDVMGRDKRFEVNNPSENSLTMAIESVKKLLEKEGINGNDIDVIVFSSQLPEYTSPPSSTIIHYAISGKSEAICYDLNANCVGMIIGLEQITKYMLATPTAKYAVLIGSDFISRIVNPEDELNYGIYGDASCAILLEKTEEDRGFIDSEHYMASEYHSNIMFPSCGFSNLLEVKEKTDIMLKWIPSEGTTAIVYAGAEDIKKLLLKHNLKNNDIKAYCLAQLSLRNIQRMQEVLQDEKSKFLYIGDKYGYTGTSSPFIAMYEGIQSGQIKRGDYIMFWVMGAGLQGITVLYKY